MVFFVPYVFPKFLHPSGGGRLLAVLLAWEADVDERGRMAAFFTVLGDALALLALQPSCPAAEDEVTPCPA